MADEVTLPIVDSGRTRELLEQSGLAEQLAKLKVELQDEDRPGVLTVTDMRGPVVLAEQEPCSESRHEAISGALREHVQNSTKQGVPFCIILANTKMDIHPIHTSLLWESASATAAPS